MVADTVSVAGLMTEMVPVRLLPTQTCDPSGVTATEPGSRPTGTVAAVPAVASRRRRVISGIGAHSRPKRITKCRVNGERHVKPFRGHSENGWRVSGEHFGR